MREVMTNIPVGVLDTDSDLTLVDNKDYIGSLNCRQYPNAKKRQKIKGNEEITDTLPAGNNESIGFLEDKYKQTGIDFIKNDLGNHRIRRFWAKENRFETLLGWNGLNFSNRINESASIDGRHLFWTDWNETGNQPRYLDMDYASLYEKKLCYELYWDSASFVAGTEYSITIEDLDGNVVLATTLFYTASGISPEANAEALAAALAGFDVTATFCGNKVKVCADTEEQRVSITSSANDIHFPGVNHYPEVMDEAYISLIHIRPRLAPFPKYVNDPVLTENKVFGFTFQFRYRYIFWNSSRSKWSPISYVPTNFTQAGGLAETVNNEGYNKIEIDFVDDVFASQNWKHLVRKVEVAVRFEFSGNWRLVGDYDIADFGVSSSQGFEFLNDGSYPVIASDENSSGDVQALGNFDFVPKFVSALEVIQDEEGRHRLALFGNTEQFDQVDCKNAEITHQLGFPDSAPSTLSDQQTSKKHFKKGGEYDVFIRYEDFYGRQWPDLFLGRYSKPWDQDGFPRIALNHQPPLEAERFWLCFSENQNQGTYFQNPAFNVTYWTKEPHSPGGDGTYTSTTFAAGNADLVGFEFIINDTDTPVNFSFRDDGKSLLVQGGDRLHIMGTTEDYLVEGYNLTTPSGVGTLDRYTVFIKFEAGQPDYSLATSSDYHLVELYRPTTGDSGLSYEIDISRGIINAGLPTRSHGGPFDIDDKGDTYRYNRKFKNIFFGSPPDVLVTDIERPQLHLFKTEVGPDFGRASTTDPDYSERYAYDQLRVSDVFVPDTGINGFQSFRGLEYVRTRRDYGRARSLQFINGVLLAICEFASQPIYVGKERLMDLSGSTSVGRTDQLLNIAGELDRMLGTQNPESIVNTGKYIYGFDSFHGAPWRYSVGGGIDEIWGNNVGLFRELGRAQEPFVLGGYEPEFDTYYLAFGGRIFRTFGYREASPEDPRRGWEGEFSFIQENFGCVGLKFFSFQQGQYFEHEIGTQLYGADFAAEMRLAMNGQPRSLKTFWNLQERGDLWHIPELNCYPITMTSMVLPAKFSNFEGQWKVDLPRDAHDPIENPNKLDATNEEYVNGLLRGRHLKGEVMDVLFRLEPEEGEMKEVTVEFTYSTETK